MSLSSKITLVSACVFSCGIIGFVHYKQFLDRDQLHQGVINDIERRQRRKAENLYNLTRQSDLTKQLKKLESSSGTEIERGKNT